METVKTIKENLSKKINLDLLSKTDMYEGVAISEILNIETEVEISMNFKAVSKEKSLRDIRGNMYYSFEIVNENVIATLKELQGISRNVFVKSVLNTVLDSSKFTQKQLDVIITEIVKNENLTLNF